jgi:hypothetical protein
MDATLTFRPGFNFAGVDKATLSFWQRSVTYENDFCFVEVSHDQQEWVQVDTLEKSSTWAQTEINLTPYMSKDQNMMWIRFRFVSNDDRTHLGTFLDNIELYPNYAVDVNERAESSIPLVWNLAQNYPNPFNPRTSISFDVPRSGHITIKIYDILGREIKSIWEETTPSGSYQVFWDGLDKTGQAVASGVYVYRIESRDFSDTRKMILIR